MCALAIGLGLGLPFSSIGNAGGSPPPSDPALLLEDGSYILLEDGSRLLLE